MAQSLILPPFARQTAVSFAKALGMSLAVKHLADEFSNAVQSLHHLRQDRTAGASLRLLRCADEDFTLYELKHVLKLCGRRGVPGPEEVTNQALNNLNAEFLPLLFDNCNNIWRSGVIRDY